MHRNPADMPSACYLPSHPPGKLRAAKPIVRKCPPGGRLAGCVGPWQGQRAGLPSGVGPWAVGARVAPLLTFHEDLSTRKGLQSQLGTMSPASLPEPPSVPGLCRSWATEACFLASRA